MSQALPYSKCDWLSDAQLREAETALRNNDWLLTKRFLNSQRRYMLEQKRVLLAD